jgi:hypothetical protein
MNPLLLVRKCLDRNGIYLWILNLLVSGCLISPHNSNFENASTVGKNNIEAAGHYSSHSYSGNNSKSITNYGFKITYGIAENTDLKISYDNFNMFLNFYEFNQFLNFYELGLKFSIVKNKSALVLPVGIYNNKYHTTFWLSPRYLSTLIRKKQFDFTTCFKMEIPLVDSTVPAFGFNATFGLSDNLNKWAVRPEIGIKFVLNTRINSLISYGIGFNYTL